MRTVSAQCNMELMELVSQHVSWLYNCVLSDTEILTDQGFKPMATVTAEDKVATVDTTHRHLWFENPTHCFRYPFSGSLIEFASNRFNLAVTPNHKMWVKFQETRGKAKAYR